MPFVYEVLVYIKVLYVCAEVCTFYNSFLMHCFKIMITEDENFNFESKTLALGKKLLFQENSFLKIIAHIWQFLN